MRKLKKLKKLEKLKPNALVDLKLNIPLKAIGYNF